MRINRYFVVFGGHPEWYTIDKKKGYVPTEKAPEEARKAMEALNKAAKAGARFD